jgi:transcriptional regulator with XRE-family HTH domain
MKTINEYLDEAKNRLGLASDYQLCKHFGVSTGTVSNWRKGARGLDNYSAMKLGEAIGKDPLAIIATTEAERETDAEKKANWSSWAKKLQGMTAACVILASSVAVIPEANAASRFSPPPQVVDFNNDASKHLILCLFAAMGSKALAISPSPNYYCSS